MRQGPIIVVGRRPLFPYRLIKGADAHPKAFRSLFTLAVVFERR
jgi:hypothetical protein